MSFGLGDSINNFDFKANSKQLEDIEVKMRTRKEELSEMDKSIKECGKAIKEDHIESMNEKKIISNKINDLRESLKKPSSSPMTRLMAAIIQFASHIFSPIFYIVSLFYPSSKPQNVKPTEESFKANNQQADDKNRV